MIARSEGIPKRIDKKYCGHTTYNVDKINRYNEKLKLRQKERVFFVTEFKRDILKENIEIKNAIIRDEDDEFIISLMHQEVENYIKEKISTVSYDDAINRYAQNIPKEKREKFYPDIEHIIVDFKTKMHEEIVLYGNNWIDDIRITQLIQTRSIDAVIHNKITRGNTESQIIDYIIQKNPNIENMPNVKNALLRRVQKTIYKINLLKK